ncbi:diaminopimelate decarboxylase [Bradyrhizobium japonicum]|uniref:Diaminopimelate decarboxylase n=1 Tax=Bradyrhizobium japonicum TaxID=375 RepID=A0A0A3Y018_BRAJP|nr:pyridoxal-dependent decarboxylase, exosortase A system-associated [Bradyrhizobium japonicum]KGT78761.1 diaminopimelate decarboxylase [Bradyrhizobium japonicum]MCS3897857.1 diaminopimelate decarboxylase [Bradyrhizobium japonicum USDA 38]MCS3940911.1 diaminopimelate decarboxylase [Bradyrhizobium japonicum]MCW2217032.1 diaminopimelate decarboxylase [Bradyrhizobium japonicum]MCW2341648.1 diaminopimelate decarboxylase [Bradyrhizobium japonicum]
MALRPTIAAFGQIEGQLAVGGVPLARLAERIGSTPFFAYDRALLTDRVKLLRSTLPRRIKLSYAIKANPMPAVTQHLATLVDAFDVASASEMRTALDTPMRPANVSFAGPGKNEASIAQAVASGVIIEIESATEVARVIKAGERLGVRPRIAVRVNPDFEVKGSGMRMGGGPQQFGIDAEKVPSLLADLAAADVEFLGFHVFAGSQNLSADLICSAQRRTVDLILELARKSPPIRYVNLGGGFGIPYFDKDHPLELSAIAGNLAELLGTAIEPQLPEARVVIELGRYIVGECGVYVTRVVDRKESRGRQYLVVDGGLHHQLAASGNFGQVIRRNYPIAVGNRLGNEAEEVVNVVGCLCTPLDLLGDNVSLPRAEIGDLIVLFQAGAYGFTASPTAFLGHPPPVEVLV